MSGAGQRILQGLKEALAGDFASVTIDGVRWVRLPAGYAVAPVEPTEAMLQAAQDALTEMYGKPNAVVSIDDLRRAAYRAMLTASDSGQEKGK